MDLEALIPDRRPQLAAQIERISVVYHPIPSPKIHICHSDQLSLLYAE